MARLSYRVLLCYGNYCAGARGSSLEGALQVRGEAPEASKLAATVSQLAVTGPGWRYWPGVRLAPAPFTVVTAHAQ